MNFFRYDYNYKIFITINLLSVALVAAIVALYKENDSRLWFIVAFLIITTIYSFLYINNLGIRITKNKVIIGDEYYFTSIKLSDIKCVKVQEIEKEKGSQIYGFIHEFYHSNTYMYHSDYVYNNGKVFKIIFYLKNNSTRESYFGWLYREKSAEIVKKVETKLYNFVDRINEMSKNS